MDDEYIARFSRQLVLPEIDFKGQDTLSQARVGIVGLGGLGSPAALYLAGAGIGFLRLFDHDVVDISNLHRQVAYRTTQIGMPKANCLAEACRALNPALTVEPVIMQLNESTILSYLQDLDIVLDATDNFQSRFALNRLCVSLKIPLIMGSAIQWEGQWAAYRGFLPEAPCYACVFPEAAKEERVSCQAVGIVGPVAGVVGNMMALLTLQALLKFNLPQVLYHFEAKPQQQKIIRLVKDPKCQVCGKEHCS